MKTVWFHWGDDDPGRQQPDSEAFRNRVAGHPGREKSKKLSELEKEGSIIIMEGFKQKKK